MPRGSEIARHIEGWFQSAPTLDPAGVLRLSDAVVALRRCVERGPLFRDPADPAPTDDAAPYLLLVDDDPTLAEGLGREARARGLEVAVAEGVDAARTLLVSCKAVPPRNIG